MPQRFLKPGITTSEKWNAAGWFAQSLYIRLLTLVDDAGRYDARVQIVHAYCFPLLDSVTRSQVESGLNELAKVGLIDIYTVGDKQFLQFTNWQERVRNKSKWPEPTGQNRLPSAAVGCRILPNAADSCRILPPSASPSPSTSPSPSDLTLVADEPQPAAKEQTDEEWLEERTTDKAYEGINVRQEYAKMMNWCQVNRKKPSRRRFVAWLNRIERPLNAAHQPTNSQSHPNRNVGTFNTGNGVYANVGNKI